MRSGFTHEALFYEDSAQFLEETVSFIREGLAAKEPVMVALAGPRIGMLRAELRADAEPVEFVDMESLGRNPGRILPAWREFVERAAADGLSTRGIGEPAWPGRSPEELTECEHHESLLNLAFADAAGFTLLCPYDAAALDAEVLDAARRHHPVVVESDGLHPSDRYVEPGVGEALLGARLAPAPGDADTLSFGEGDLPAIRDFVRERAAAAGIERDRLADVVLAVNELATNSMRHGGGTGILRAWLDQRALHCEVEDAGRVVDPLLGRTRPTPSQDYGRGLWLVHQLCDLFQLRSGPAGTIARISMARA